MTAPPRKEQSEEMDDTAFAKWAAGYLGEAAADEYARAVAVWADEGIIGIEGEGYPVETRFARRMVENNVDMVSLVLGFARLDNLELADRFLALQTYDPAVSEAKYCLIFELGIHRRTRLLVDGLDQIDLADLWGALEFDHLDICRRDGLQFEPGEHAALRERITYDLRFDFCQDELEIVLEEHPASLHVELYG